VVRVKGGGIHILGRTLPCAWDLCIRSMAKNLAKERACHFSSLERIENWKKQRRINEHIVSYESRTGVQRKCILADQSILIEDPCLLNIKRVWSNAITEIPKIYLNIRKKSSIRWESCNEQYSWGCLWSIVNTT